MVIHKSTQALCTVCGKRTSYALEILYTPEKWKKKDEPKLEGVQYALRLAV